MEFSLFCQKFLGQVPSLKFQKSTKLKADGSPSKRLVCINLPFEGSLVTTEEFDSSKELHIYDNLAEGCQRGVDYILSNSFKAPVLEIDLAPYKEG